MIMKVVTIHTKVSIRATCCSPGWTMIPLTAAMQPYLPIVRVFLLLGGAMPDVRECLIQRVEAALHLQDQNHAEPSDKLEIEERRLQTPLRNPPRHDTGDRRGGNPKKDRRPQSCRASGHDVAPASQIPACTRDSDAVVALIVAAGDWGD